MDVTFSLDALVNLAVGALIAGGIAWYYFRKACAEMGAMLAETRAMVATTQVMLEQLGRKIPPKAYRNETGVVPSLLGLNTGTGVLKLPALQLSGKGTVE